MRKATRRKWVPSNHTTIRTPSKVSCLSWQHEGNWKGSITTSLLLFHSPIRIDLESFKIWNGHKLYVCHSRNKVSLVLSGCEIGCHTFRL